MVRKPLRFLYASLVYIFLYMPIILLVAYSFNKSKYVGKWEGFTFSWYEQLFQDSSIASAVSTTLLVAVVASIAATIIGTMAALAIHSMSPRARALMDSLTYIPMLNPDIVIGISLLSLFAFLSSFTGLQLGYTTLILAHITFNIPYVIFAVLPKLQQLNPHLEEAAMDLGATPLQAFLKVIMPEIMPGVFSGALMAFTLSLDDFIVSFFTTGGGVSTLSIKVYSMTKRGISPKINALSSLMFIVVLGLMLIIQIQNNRQDNKASRRAL